MGDRCLRSRSTSGKRRASRARGESCIVCVPGGCAVKSRAGARAIASEPMRIAHLAGLRRRSRARRPGAPELRASRRCWDAGAGVATGMAAVERGRRRGGARLLVRMARCRARARRTMSASSSATTCRQRLPPKHTFFYFTEPRPRRMAPPGGWRRRRESCCSCHARSAPGALDGLRLGPDTTAVRLSGSARPSDGLPRPMPLRRAAPRPRSLLRAPRSDDP